MKLLILSLFASIALAGPVERRTSYDGNKVFRVSLESETHVAHMNYVIKKMGLDVWTHSVGKGKNVDVMVSAGNVDAFLRKTQGLTTSVMHHDLGAAIAEEAKFAPYVSRK